KFSRTAHDSSIVKLAFSPNGAKLVSASEGRELVLWDAAALTPIHRFEPQPDVVTGLAFERNGHEFYVARIDGSWKRYAVPKDGHKNSIADDKQSTLADSTADDKSPRAELTEHEPNNSSSTANAISTNSVTKGVISNAAKAAESDVDLFRFRARKGERLVLEINAA